MKREIIILMGLPGSGKGRVAAALMHGRDYNYIETGALFRGTNNATIRECIAAGALIPDDAVNAAVTEKLDAARDNITDGFPRSRPQAEYILNFAAAHDMSVRVVFLDMPDAVVFRRISQRAAEGGARADDAAAQKRIDAYHAVTAPAIEYLRARLGRNFIRIDASRSEEEVKAEARERVTSD